MTSAPSGTRHRFHRLSADLVQSIRLSAPARDVDPRKRKPGHRYCETCATMRPANAQPHVKGWQCDLHRGNRDGGEESL